MGFEQTIILAALLHDIAQISQREKNNYQERRGEFSKEFITALNLLFGGDYAKRIIRLITNYYHTPSRRDECILHLADQLATAGDYKKETARFSSKDGALAAITSKIEIHREHEKEKYYSPVPLQMKDDFLCPVDKPDIKEGDYKSLEDKFIKKIKLLGTYQASDFTTLYFILKEIGSLAPSATPWENTPYNAIAPDVSLFEHSKVTCALAACLAQLPEKKFTNDAMSELIIALKKTGQENHPDKRTQLLAVSKHVHTPLFLFLRADIAGIQKFIYSITSPRGDTKGTSKRLRGRSFYLSLLSDVIADWILRKLDLPLTNILFCGGGRFDLLLPYTERIQQKIDELGKELDIWLLEKFKGALGVQMACILLTSAGFFDFSRVYRNAEDKLVEKKAQKFNCLLSRPDFFKSYAQVDAICNSCLMAPVSDSGPCEQCQTHQELGRCLPKKNFLSFVYGNDINSGGVLIPFEDFGVSVLLQDKNEMMQLIKSNNSSALCIYRLNPNAIEGVGLDFLRGLDCLEQTKQKQPFSFGFKFFGNSAPLALKDCRLVPASRGELTKKDEVLEFNEIAALSMGAKYLGILKMDVDYLGLLFSLGIEQPSISQVATLSSNLEFFFNCRLNTLCQKVTKKWDQSLSCEDSKKGLIESLFYVVYSGGDDLFIIGPWDKIIDLAKLIYTDFREFTCRNPNITLSGGVLFVKPHFPIHRFAKLVSEELEKSKQDADRQMHEEQYERDFNEKDRITLFGETLKWEDSIIGPSFDEALSFAQDLIDLIEKKKDPLTKNFVYFLGYLEKYAHKMWVPHLFYALARRVKDPKVRGELKNKIPRIMGKMKIPVSYVSLKTRKE